MMPTRPARVFSPTAALAVATAAAWASPPTTAPAATRPVNAGGGRDALTVALQRAHDVDFALIASAHAHHDRYPDRLSDLLPFTKGAAEPFVTPGDQRRLGRLPTSAPAAWVDAHASFAYPAAGTAFRGDYGGRLTSNVVVLHSRLDDPFDSSHGPVVVVGFADGHTEPMTVGAARTAIADSVEVLAYSRAEPAAATQRSVRP